MAKEDVPTQTGEGEAFSEQVGPLIVGPLARKIAYETEKLERALDGFRVELHTNLDVLKREILERIGEVEAAVETIAREMAQKGSHERGDNDRRDAR